MKDVRKVFTITGLKSLSAALAVLTTLVATMLFEPAEFGTISLVWSVAVIFAVFLDFGSSLQIRKLAPRLSRRRSLWRRLTRSIFLGLWGRLVLSLQMVALYLYVFGSDRFAVVIWLAALIAIGFAFELLSVEVFRARRWYALAEYCNGGFRQTIYMVCLGAAAVLVLSDTALMVLFLVAVVVLAVAMYLFAARPSFENLISEVRLSAPKGKRQFYERGRFFVVSLIIMVSQQLPVVAAAVLSSEEVAAYVRVAVLFGVLMQFLVSANAMYFAPMLAAAGPRNKATLQALVSQSARIGFLFVPLGLVGAALIPFVVRLLFEESYEASIVGAQILVLTHTLTCTLGAYAQMILLSGRERVVMIGVSVGLVVQVAAMMILANDPGATIYVGALSLGLLASTALQVTIGWRMTGITPGPFSAAKRSAET